MTAPLIGSVSTRQRRRGVALTGAASFSLLALSADALVAGVLLLLVAGVSQHFQDVSAGDAPTGWVNRAILVGLILACLVLLALSVEASRRCLRRLGSPAPFVTTVCATVAASMAGIIAAPASGAFAWLLAPAPSCYTQCSAVPWLHVGVLALAFDLVASPAIGAGVWVATDTVITRQAREARR